MRERNIEILHLNYLKENKMVVLTDEQKGRLSLYHDMGGENLPRTNKLQIMRDLGFDEKTFDTMYRQYQRNLGLVK